MPKVSRTWHQPSASLGREFFNREPARLPIASPIRNTAKMMEKTYTVAPSIMPMILVQITSAPRALAPDSAVVT